MQIKRLVELREKTSLCSIYRGNEGASSLESFYLLIPMALQSCVGPWPLFFSFLTLYTVGRTPLTGDQPVARPLPTHRSTQNKRTQTSMPRVRFEPTIPAFERAKTVHALDRAASVIGIRNSLHSIFYILRWDIKTSLQTTIPE
jgi:hypothetical protein